MTHHLIRADLSLIRHKIYWTTDYRAKKTDLTQRDYSEYNLDADQTLSQVRILYLETDWTCEDP